MAWSGQATEAEMKAVLDAVHLLENKPHISHMSYEPIAKTTYTIKPTAVRWIIPELVKGGYLIQLKVGEQKVPRYFYKLTDKGAKFMNGGNS